MGNMMRGQKKTGVKTICLLVMLVFCFTLMPGGGGEKPALAAGEFTVLELQPAAVKSGGLTEGQVEGWMRLGSGVTDANIKIVTMTTGEFVGRTEDLNSTYDLIYIGANTTGMNTDSSGLPVYNDSSNMNGLIYTSIGDLYRSNITLAGLLDRDYFDMSGVSATNRNTVAIDLASGSAFSKEEIREVLDGNKVLDDRAAKTTGVSSGRHPASNANLFRFSGNDITEACHDDIIAFAKSGYPVVVADEKLMANNFQSPNPDRVDAASNMYAALNTIVNLPGNNVKQQSEVEKNAQNKKVSPVSGVEIVFSADPGDSTKPLKPKEYKGTNRNDKTGFPEYRGSLDFTFQITGGTAGAGYDCNLYLDLNSDGSFDKVGEEQVVTITQGDPPIPVTTALSGGVEYTLQCPLGADIAGGVAWKLEVVRTGTGFEHEHTAQTGLTRVKPPAASQLNILQIMKADTTGTHLNLADQRAGTIANYQLKDTDIVYRSHNNGYLYNTYYVPDEDGNVPENTKINWYEPESAVTDPADFLGTLQRYEVICLQEVDFTAGGEQLYYSNALGRYHWNGASWEKLGKAVLYNDFIAGYDSGTPFLFMNMKRNEGEARKEVVNNVVGDEWQWTIIDCNIAKFENGEKYWCNGVQLQYNKASGQVKLYSEDLDWAGSTTSAESDRVRSIQSMTHPDAVETNYRVLGEWVDDGEKYCYRVKGVDYPARIDTGSIDVTDPDAFPTAYVGAGEWIYEELFDDVEAMGDFTVDIDTIETDDLEAMGGKDDIYDHLDGYDMLIIGFADVFKEVEANSAQAILQYINNKDNNDEERPGGKRSVLFSHDTTSPINVDSDIYITKERNSLDTGGFDVLQDGAALTIWGYLFNTQIRDTVGLDRYGVTIENDSGVSLPSSYISANYSARSSSKPEIQGFTNYALIHNNVPQKDDDKAPRGEGDHLNTGNVYRITIAEKEGTSSNPRYPIDHYVNYESTQYIEQVNTGKITSYPFDVNTTAFGGTGNYIEVGKTHEQYYQLNMNADDTVVWYCLSAGPEQGISFYKDVPKDVTNAYYLYTKDNLTYYGMGHSADETFFINRDEAELLVNLIIASYRGSERVEIVDDATTPVPVTEDDYRYFTQVGDDILEKGEGSRLYFRIIDSQGSDKFTASFRYELPDGITTVTIPAPNPVNYWDITAATGGTVANGNLVAGEDKVYWIDLLPATGSNDDFEDDLVDNPYLELTVSITPSGGTTPTAAASQTIMKKQISLLY